MSDPMMEVEIEEARSMAEEEGPRCGKCGAEMTTALMAAFCPAKRKCEFWTPELDTFLAKLMQAKE